MFVSAATSGQHRLGAATVVAEAVHGGDRKTGRKRYSDRPDHDREGPWSPVALTVRTRAPLRGRHREPHRAHIGIGDGKVEDAAGAN